jgi:hypothetical protein
MASTYSQLKIELIGTGDQAGTWGATTNVNLGTALEEAITGSANVTFASSNVALALTDTNAAQTARNLRLNLVGTISNQQHLFVPPIEKQYLVVNGLTNSVIIANGSNTGATGTTFTLPAGRSSIVFNDGTNINDVVTFVSTLGNVTITGGTANALVLSNVSIVSGNANNITSNASTFSNVSITSGNINAVTSNASTFTNATITTATVNGGTANGVQSSNVTIVSGVVGNTTVNAYTENVLVVGNTGNAVTLNIANATVLTATLTANCTFTMPSNTAGKSFVILLNTGNGNFTSTFTGVRWSNGNTAPTITTTNNRVDILTFIANGAAWYGSAGQNYIP